MFDLKGKIALVTGGAQGIGLSIIRGLLHNHLKAVAIVDVDEIIGKKSAEDLELEFGLGKTVFIKADVSSRSEFDDALKKTIETYKNLDIIVNNAGVLNDKDWEKEILVNLTGTVNGTLLGFEDYLSKNKNGNEGVILNIASILGFHFHWGCPVYSATKSGVIALTRAMGQPAQYSRKNVRVVAICPGFTETSLTIPNPNRLISHEYANHFKDYFTAYPTTFQTPEEVAKAALHIIQYGENGSIWIAENKNDPYEVEPLPYSQLKKIKQ